MRRRQSLLVQMGLYGSLVLLAFWGVLTAVNYYTSSQIIASMTQQMVDEALHQSAQTIDQSIRALKMTANTLATDKALVAFASQASTEQTEVEARAVIDTIIACNADLVSAVIVTQDGRILSNNDQLQMTTSQDMMAQDWYREALAHPMMPTLTSARQLSLGENQQDWVISVTRDLSDPTTGKHLGVLRLDIRYQALAHTLQQLNLGTNGLAYVVSDTDQFVYHPDATIYQSREAQQALLQQTAQAGLDMGQKQYRHIEPLSEVNWRLIGVASLQQLDALQQQVLGSFLVSGGLLLVLAIGGFIWLMRRWLRPIYQLQQTMQQSGNHELKRVAELESIPTTEFYQLSDGYNRMVARIEQLMSEVQAQEQSAKRYELMALTSQINPHFLYNTLDTIIWMAEFQDNEKVIDLTKALAKYFRLALNQGRDIMTLQEEFDHLQQYLYIQQQRYGDKLHYELDLPAEYEEVLVPKLVLQPLVENAIYHGLKSVERDWQIRVTVTPEAEHLLISIYDNGVGLHHHQTQATTKLGGVGLANVEERLKLYYGVNFRMDIMSEDQLYTEVKLYIPNL